MPVVCVCGKEFATEAGHRQHIRRRYCRGAPAPLFALNNDEPPLANCPICQRQFNTYAGMRQHMRKAHPREYNQDLEHQVENPVRAANAWLDEEVLKMARLEVAYTGRFINSYLLELMPGRTLDSIKSKRSTREYRELLNSIDGGLAVDLIEEALEPMANVEDAGEADVELTEEEMVVVMGAPPARINVTENPIREYLYSIFETVTDWDDKDSELITFIRNNSSQNVTPELLPLLDTWLEDLIQLTGTDTNIVRRPSRRKRQNHHDRQYGRGAKRAHQYKLVQELYKKDRRKLARHILDDEPLTLGLDQRPSDDAIREHYSAIFEAVSPEDNEAYPDVERVMTVEAIPEAEIRGALTAMKETAPGPDRIKISALRSIPIRKLTLLYNTMLLYSAVPTSLTKNRTILIPKGKPSPNISEWRPITIASTILRLVNKIMAKRLSQLNLHKNQRGFRQVDGVLLNNLTLQALIKEKRLRLKPYTAIAIDLSKAFDSVSHESIMRGLRRVGVDEATRNLIKAQYSRVTTTIEMGGKSITELAITRGVKQGDPLSPILFNIVLDELFEQLDGQKGGGGLTLGNNFKVKAIGYADDMLFLDDTIAGAQKTLRYAEAFFSKRGLSINPSKSVALSAGVVPGKKVMVTYTTPKFYVRGVPIKQLGPEDLFKYLGGRYGQMGQTFDGTNVHELLRRLGKSPLKPFQKLEILRVYLIPRLLHNLQNVTITKKALKNTDRVLRIFIRKALHLNKTTADAFLHAQIREGGLGIVSLWAHVPAILKSRITAMQLTDEPLTHTVLSTNYILKFRDKIDRWAAWNGGNTRRIHAFFSDKLEDGYSGGGLRQGASHAASGAWIREPPTFWKGRDFVEAVQLRSNMLPTKGIPSNPREERVCRGCGRKSETLCHVLQNCSYGHWPRIKRHDRVVRRLRQLAERKGWIVTEEPAIRRVDGILLKPDLLMQKANRVVVCDVTVPWEGRDRPLEVAYEDKVAKYSTPEFLETVRRKYPNKEVATMALTIGARGIWCSRNDRLVNELQLTRNEVASLINNTINGSILVYKEFMRSVWARRRNGF